MPRIPDYGGLKIPKDVLSPAPLRAEPMPDIAGAQVRQFNQVTPGIENLNRQALRFSLAMQEQADQVRINAALNEAVAARLEMTHGDRGYTHHKGVAVTKPMAGSDKSVVETYQESYRNALRDIEDSLSSDRQKAIFRDRAGALYNQYNDSLTRYVNAEFFEYSKAEGGATIGTAQEQSKLEWGNPALIEQSANAIKAASYRVGQLNGWPAEQVDLFTLAQLSKSYMGAIEAAVDAGSVDYAQALYGKHENEITGDDRLRAKKLLQAGDEDQQVFNAVQGALQKFPGDYRAAKEYVLDNYQGQVGRKAYSEIGLREADNKVAAREAEVKLSDDVFSILEKTPRQEAVPTTMWEALPAARREHYLNYINRTREQAAKGEKIQTNLVVYNDLYQLHGTDPQAFTKLYLPDYADRLSPEDFKHFVKLQDTLRTKGTSDPEYLRVATGTQIVDNATKNFSKENKVLFQKVFWDQQNVAQQENGKPLNYEEMRKLADFLVMNSKDSGGWFKFSKDKVYKLIDKGTPVDIIISDRDIEEALASLQKAKPGVVYTRQDAIDFAKRVNTPIGQ